LVIDDKKVGEGDSDYFVSDEGMTAASAINSPKLGLN
jgi:hypothetical protein